MARGLISGSAWWRLKIEIEFVYQIGQLKGNETDEDETEDRDGVRHRLDGRVDGLLDARTARGREDGR